VLINTKLEKVLRKTPQYTRLMRHARSFAAHSTPKKVANLLVVEREWRSRKPRLKGRPYIIIVEPTNICNLRCRLCPTGTGESGRRASILRHEKFVEIIDRFAPYAYEVNFQNWGEPLLNGDVFRMIEYAQKNNIATNMSTNLNTVRETDIDNLARSGLEYLSVSLDGTTEDVYSHYRKRGDFHRVVDNLRALIAKRETMRQKTPFIEWQFIVMKHNIHQIEDAKLMADRIGVDLLRFIPVGLPFWAEDKKKLGEEWYPKYDGGTNNGDGEHQWMQKPKKTACFYLYRSITINSDGGVSPCCVVYGEQNDFAVINGHDPLELYNNEHFVSARALFSARVHPTVHTVCEHCNIFERNGNGEPESADDGAHRQALVESKAKRVIEVGIAAAILILSLPVMAVIALLIRLDSRGPVIFRQTRIGRNQRGNGDSAPEGSATHERRRSDLGGKPFTFYKFRTMLVDAQKRHPELYRYEYGPKELGTLCFKLKKDPRLTRFGRRLRKTTLDELPNLVNVIKGDMSLVGPRPDIPEMIRYYKQWQRKKFEVKPGVTGLAQVSGRGLLSIQETLRYDVKYVKTKCLRTDLKILARTVKATILRIGAF
jgi:lipopolysaccharide/colanic/teichoic acid biosynthesis glycosyltransferase/pyruvate-formate lyase-activating enzyme